MQVEICTICNNKIGLREQVCVFNYEIVCERCDNELRKVPSLRVCKVSSKGFGSDKANPLQLAFARYLGLLVGSEATQSEAANMIDEELAYRKLVSVENASKRIFYPEVKSLKSTTFFAIGILFIILSWYKI